jgi:hypothetical protein
LRRNLALLIVFALIVGLVDCRAVAAQGAAELAGLLVVLQQLKSQMDSVLNTVDQETAARIRQAEIALDSVIEQIKNAMDHGYGLINNTRDQVMGNIATVMIQMQSLIQGTIGVAFLAMNDTLANLARILAHTSIQERT